MKRSPSEHAQSDILLGDRIEAISRRSPSTYGRPRIHAELVDEGEIDTVASARSSQDASSQEIVGELLQQLDGIKMDPARVFTPWSYRTNSHSFDWGHFTSQVKTLSSHQATSDKRLASIRAEAYL